MVWGKNYIELVYVLSRGMGSIHFLFHDMGQNML